MKHGIGVFESISFICFGCVLVSILTRNECHENGVVSNKPIVPELIITAKDTTYIYKSDKEFVIFEKWNRK